MTGDVREFSFLELLCNCEYSISENNCVIIGMCTKALQRTFYCGSGPTKAEDVKTWSVWV